MTKEFESANSWCIRRHCNWWNSKKQIYAVLVMLCGMAAIGEVKAVIFYVDSFVASEGSGTQALPFKTIGKVNTIVLASGDQVLFKRTAVFAGKLEAKYAGVTYGAYGTGAKPKFTGKLSSPYEPNVIVVTKPDVIIQDLWIEPALPKAYNKSTDDPDHGVRHWTFDDYTVTNGILVDGSVSSLSGDNTTIQRCDFRYLARGIFLKRSDTNFANSCRISQCTFKNICLRWINSGGNGVLEGAMAIDMQGNNHEIFDNVFDDRNTSSEIQKTGTSVEVFDSQYCKIYRNQSFNARVFSEMGGKKPTTVNENTYEETTWDNEYQYNLFVSDREGAKFLTTRGRFDVNGPVLRTKVYNNTIRLTYFWDSSQVTSR
jgi:hypothetical protein